MANCRVKVYPVRALNVNIKHGKADYYTQLSIAME